MPQTVAAWVIEYACYLCEIRAVRQKGGSKKTIGHTAEPIKDGWSLTPRGDMRFNPDGASIWICPECAAKHGLKPFRDLGLEERNNLYWPGRIRFQEKRREHNERRRRGKG
jgi:hypothetical protein